MILNRPEEAGPHSAWYSTAALEDMRRKAATDVLRVLRGEKPRYPVK